jgi:hypothetical protein
MDFNVNGASFDRIIIHQIHAKTPTEDFSSVTLAESILSLSEPVISTLKNRISQALQKESRAFDAAIANISPGSFYDLSTSLWASSTQEFIEISGRLAALLAEAQRRIIIPESYLIIIKGVLNRLNFTLVIKAELHEALFENRTDGHITIELIERVFLSPANKLYKIGLIYNSTNPDPDAAGPNHDNCCLLYDDNNNLIGDPAEYFYRDFLGFDPSNDARLKTKQFYKRLVDYVQSDITEGNLKQDLFNAIETVFYADQTALIDPIGFMETYIPEGCKSKYVDKILSHYTRPFIKDVSLIQRSVNKKRITFGNIKIEGPIDEFNQRITLVPAEEIINLDPSSLSEFTFVKIHGRPYGQ